MRGNRESIQNFENGGQGKGELDDNPWNELRNWGNEDSEKEQLKEKIEIIKLPQEIIEKYPVLSELPDGVCVMGGMARSITREVITGDIEPIRDIDLVNILDDDGESLVDEETLDYLARKYMADDYAFGHGINSEGFDDYFETRDFTVNQCLIRGGELLVTRQAYDDFQENIIRPTEYELSDEWGLSSRLFMKALMMKTVFSRVTDSVPTMEDVEVERIYPFDVALTLNKMMSRGAEMAVDFTYELADWEIIPWDYRGKPMRTAAMLLDYVYDFDFRPVDPDDTREGDERDLSGYFSDNTLDEYHPRNSVIRSILEEYDGLSPRDYYFTGRGDYVEGERVRGKYMFKDYEKMNL